MSMKKKKLFIELFQEGYDLEIITSMKKRSSAMCFSMKP
jgi:hypothetical protein